MSRLKCCETGKDLKMGCFHDHCTGAVDTALESLVKCLVCGEEMSVDYRRQFHMSVCKGEKDDK